MMESRETIYYLCTQPQSPQAGRGFCLRAPRRAGASCLAPGPPEGLGAPRRASDPPDGQGRPAWPQGPQTLPVEGLRALRRLLVQRPTQAALQLV